MSQPIERRVDGYDWDAAGAELQSFGCTVLPGLLKPR
jgi:hypothetical protein